jgi:hypothetical protein
LPRGPLAQALGSTQWTAAATILRPSFGVHKQ